VSGAPIGAEGAVGWEDSGWTCMRPGSRKVAGETLPWALIPLHPVQSKVNPRPAIPAATFQVNLTRRV